MNLCFISKYIFFKSVAKIKLTLTFWIQQNAAKKNLGFKNLLAEICHFNTPTDIRTSLAKKNQRVLRCGVRLHFHKHFDQNVWL